MKQEIQSKPLPPRRRIVLSIVSFVLFLGIIVLMVWSAQESQQVTTPHTSLQNERGGV